MLVIFSISNDYILKKRNVVEKLLWETSLAVRNVKIETETDANLKNVTHHNMFLLGLLK